MLEQAYAQGQVSVFHLQGNGTDAALGCDRRLGHHGELGHLGFDLHVPGVHHLTAEVVVGLEAVVLLRIVARGDDHAAGGAQGLHGEAEEGRGQGTLAEEHLIARRRQDRRAFCGEDIGFDPGVVTHHGDLLPGRVELGDGRQGHGGPAHVRLVHAPQSGGHEAAEAPGPEGQGLEEPVLQFSHGGGITALGSLHQGLQLGPELGFKVGEGKVPLRGAQGHGDLAGSILGSVTK